MINNNRPISNPFANFNLQTQPQPQYESNMQMNFNQINQFVNNPLIGHMSQHLTNQIPQSYFSIKDMLINQSTRYYFDVDNQYVLKKLCIVFFPFLFKGKWGKSSQEYSQDHQGFLSPKNETHSSDLFIPLMSLMTFVLGICFSRGIGQQFQPELIGDYLSRTITIVIIEMLIIKLMFFMVKLNEASFLDILSHISYKFAILSVLKLLGILFSPLIIYILKIYFLVVNGLFLYKTLQRYSQTSMSIHLDVESDVSKVMFGSLIIDFLFMLLLYYLCL